MSLVAILALTVGVLFIGRIIVDGLSKRYFQRWEKEQALSDVLHND